MVAPSPREQALSLLAAANNNGDLAVKLSSLKQLKDILLAAEPFQAAELFPYLVELQSSHEPLVRKTLIEVIEDIGLKSLNHFSIFIQVLLTFLHDGNSSVVKQSIVTGTSIFSTVLEELALQFHRRGHVDMWLEELWTQTSKFKDAVIDILFEAAPLAVKLLTIKFIETNILLFTSDRNDSEISPAEAISRERTFSISWLAGHHPVLNKAALSSDANRFLGIMLDLLQSAKNLPGLLTISIVNSLATIAKRRPALYSHILSALLKFDPNFEMAKGCHVASTQYSIRTALLGFLRCTHPTILESRERLMKALRAMNAGDAADQVIRQVEKIMRMSERAARDARLSKEEQMSDYLPNTVDQGRKRSQPSESEDPNNYSDIAPKRVRYGTNAPIATPADIDDTRGKDYINGVSAKGPLLDNNMTPVEQMIAMIGALIAEGERGVESLELLVSNMHPDLLADIVITNMRHLPKNPPSLVRATPSIQSNTSDLTHNVASTVSTSPEVAAQESSLNSLPSDPKRDQRRDPRRLDPRRSMASTVSVTEDAANAAQTGAMEYLVDSQSSFVKAPSPPGISASESSFIPFMPKPEANLTSIDSLPASQSTIKEEADKDTLEEAKSPVEVPDITLGEVEQDSGAQISYQFVPMDDVYSSSSLEIGEHSPDISDIESPESPCLELPVVPSYINLTEEQQRALRTSAIERIFDSYKNLRDPVSTEMRMALLARMVAMVETDNEAIVEMQRHLAFHYHHQKGQELVMHVLFHLHSLTLSSSEGSSSLFASMYENSLLEVVKSVLDNIPSNDKSIGRLLREVPFLTDSIMGLLDDLCCDKYMGTDSSEIDRVTQGLGALLNLIVWRPLNRQACLDIALKCAVHPKDNVRVKAINLVAKKLYAVSYISENIEQFAMRMFLSVVDQRPLDVDSQSEVFEQRTERETGSQETSVSGSHISEMGLSENNYIKGGEMDTQNFSVVGLSHAQQHVSLFFALFPQKPSLLRIVFENYERSPKATKQAVHRQIPALVRAFGSRYSDLLQVISDPPPGSESLLTQVLHILSEGTPQPPDLVAFVKHLYETKLKDASILIPIISSFSRNEVLPIFPQLVNLPLDKFQTALAHILQGSANTGPALTPAEVMVAIHDIHPDRDRLPLKKITDACSVCFEQRTVFTQQVMSKALDQMVGQTPLPLLFMRTVIQTTDAFPALVDFVMELLSKLVGRQVWRMPKLWVGFLKCVSQTQPHSFRVLLQLPPPQLESALNKYPHLRGPLAAYASQPSIRNSLSRPTLLSLGLTNEANSGDANSGDANSSLKGTMPT